MARSYDEIRTTLLEGLKRSGQGSYDRRQPSKRALPFLRQARHELVEFLAASPNHTEAWRSLSLAHESVLAYGPALAALERALDLVSKPNNKDVARLAMLKAQGVRGGVVQSRPNTRRAR